MEKRKIAKWLSFLLHNTIYCGGMQCIIHNIFYLLDLKKFVKSEEHSSSSVPTWTKFVL